MKTVIVGAGQAGAWVARTLRSLRPDVEITLVGSEAHAPYERPSLSKGLLSRVEDSPPCLLSRSQALASDIKTRYRIEVQTIDRKDKLLRLSDGGTLPYDKLVLATGGRARLPAIPGITLPGVHTLRTLDDAIALRDKIQAGKRMLVLGGGWIGLEVAATAKQAGMQVTVIEGGNRLCSRSVPPEVSEFLLDMHLCEGIDVQLNGSVSAISASTSGTVQANTHLCTQEFDLIVVGIGLQPNTALAENCGLKVDNGILVDSYGRTLDPDIYAAGDVTNQPCTWQGAVPDSRIRLESWVNAQNQGIAVGRALAGMELEAQDIPWFWSDQYDVNLQVLGIPSTEAITVQRGSKQDRAFCLFQFTESRLSAVIAVNMARELKLAKRWMKAGICPSPTQLSDPEFRLDKFKPKASTAPPEGGVFEATAMAG
ncbi:FAD-dependent oxidoreductase [Alcaligenaceae bacterium]|nr:FAD-dependent oxidoreductase [Alcaligenaceae bacterium]